MHRLRFSKNSFPRNAYWSGYSPLDIYNYNWQEQKTTPVRVLFIFVFHRLLFRGRKIAL